jgi:hypothetical protein
MPDDVKDSMSPNMIEREKILESNRKRKEEKAKRKELIRVVREEGREERKAVQIAWEAERKIAREAEREKREIEAIEKANLEGIARKKRETEVIRNSIYGKWNQNGIWAHPHCSICGRCRTNSSSHHSGHPGRIGYRSSSCQHD